MKKHITDIITAVMFACVLGIAAVSFSLNNELQKSREANSELRTGLATALWERDKMTEVGVKFYRENEQSKNDLYAARQTNIFLENQVKDSEAKNKDLQNANQGLTREREALAKNLSQKDSEARRAASFVFYQDRLINSLENILIAGDVPKSRVTVKPILLIPKEYYVPQAIIDGDKKTVLRSLGIAQRWLLKETGVTFNIGGLTVFQSRYDLQHYSNITVGDTSGFKDAYNELASNIPNEFVLFPESTFSVVEKEKIVRFLK